MFIIEGSADTDIPEFMMVTKKGGSITHNYVGSQCVYVRKRVDPDGKACFICPVRGCPVKMHAKYESKEVSNGDQEPVITT